MQGFKEGIPRLSWILKYRNKKDRRKKETGEEEVKRYEDNRDMNQVSQIHQWCREVLYILEAY